MGLKVKIVFQLLFKQCQHTEGKIQSDDSNIIRWLTIRGQPCIHYTYWVVAREHCGVKVIVQLAGA